MTGGVRLLDEKLTIGARGYITSKSLSVGPTRYPGPPGFLDGYTTVDIFTSYKVTDDVTVAATATNVADVAYTPALRAAVLRNGEPDSC